MLVRLDKIVVPGIFSTDGYIDARGRFPDEISSLVLKRLADSRLQKKAKISVTAGWCTKIVQIRVRVGQFSPPLSLPIPGCD